MSAVLMIMILPGNFRSMLIRLVGVIVRFHEIGLGQAELLLVTGWISLPATASPPLSPNGPEKTPEPAQADTGHSTRLHRKHRAMLEHTEDQTARQANDRPANQDKGILVFPMAGPFAFRRDFFHVGWALARVGNSHRRAYFLCSS